MTPQELKNSILQLAIQGKLVEQRPEEGTADFSGLKVKSTEEFEYELPDKWRLAHLETISRPIPTKQYQVLESEVNKEGIYVVISQSKEYSIGFSNDSNKVFHHNIPVVVFGDHTTVVKLITFDFVVGADGVKIFEPLVSVIEPKFLFYVFQYNCIDLSKVGGYRRHYKYIKDKPIPVPPLGEQKRIVAKIEELLPLIDRYEKAWTRLEDFNKRFPGDMQKSILQMAIQGKLVDQRPEEGTGEELYQQIQKEKQALIKAGKIKKEKPYSSNVSYLEHPFDIPDSWYFVRFGDLMINRDSERIPVSTNERAHRAKIYDYYGASGVIDKIDDYIFDKELLLLGEDGANLLTRSTPIAFLARGKYWVNNHAHVLDSCAGLNLSYVCYYINAISLAPYVTGTAQPKMNQENMNAIWVPLPPLAEQKRIVARLEELLPLCEKLK